MWLLQWKETQTSGHTAGSLAARAPARGAKIVLKIWSGFGRFWNRGDLGQFWVVKFWSKLDQMLIKSWSKLDHSSNFDQILIKPRSGWFTVGFRGGGLGLGSRGACTRRRRSQKTRGRLCSDLTQTHTHMHMQGLWSSRVLQGRCCRAQQLLCVGADWCSAVQSLGVLGAPGGGLVYFRTEAPCVSCGVAVRLGVADGPPPEKISVAAPPYFCSKKDNGPHLWTLCHWSVSCAIHLYTYLWKVSLCFI